MDSTPPGVNAGTGTPQAPDTTPWVPTGNLALASNGGTIIDYSHQESNGPAQGVIDGEIAFNADNKTWMVRKPKKIEYITIGLKDLYTISSINHWNDGQCGAKSVTIKYSQNGVDWQTLGTFELNTTYKTPTRDILTFSPVTARYLRFEYSYFNNRRWFQVNEIEIFGTKVVNVALTSNGGKVVDYSHQYSTGPVTGLIDGEIVFNTDNKSWTVRKPQAPEYVTLEFNNVYAINSVNHWNDGQYGAKSVTIKYSQNGVDWETIGTFDLTIVPNTPTRDVLIFNPVNARYLRFEYSSFNSRRWLQIDELEVFGEIYE